MYDFTDIPGIETHSSQTVSKLLDPKIYTANLKSDYEYYVVHERNAYFNDLVTHLCNFFVDDNPSILLDIFAVNLPNVNTDFDALPESIRRASKGIVVSVDEEGNLFSKYTATFETLIHIKCLEYLRDLASIAARKRPSIFGQC